MVNNQDNPQPTSPSREEAGAAENRKTLQTLVEESFHSLREGDVVRGTVVAVNDNEVVVDIGFKSEGIIPRSEFSDRSGKVTVKPGDEVDVLVERFDEAMGDIRLSHERAAKLRVWEVLETAFRDAIPVRGRVLERVKGGLAVDIGVRAFLPGSLVDLRPTRRLEDYIGEDVETRIINFDRRRANVVLSRKVMLEEQVSVQKDETLKDLEEGTIISGVVKNITDYGVFIDLGGIDGLLHVTDISWGRVGHPSEYFKVGDEVKVVVLRVDRDKERVSLGYRQRFEDPWTHVEAKYPAGKKITGRCTNVVDYGAFVELEEGVEGLIHVSEMSWTKKIKNPKSILHTGQEVEVVITEVDVEKRRLSLSLRQAESNPWDEFATRYRVGSKVKGLVRNLTDFGAFVEIEPGVDGLVHVSDMAWSRRISHPSEVVQKGQEIEAMVIAMDIANQRISLSIKELLPNEWDEFANTHQVGDEVEGFITNVTDFGLFVELAPGVEGLCHISEVERRGTQPLTGAYERGNKVRTRLIRIDWNEKRIGLSLRGVTQPEEEDSSLAALAGVSGDELGAEELQVEAAEAQDAPVEDVKVADAPLQDAVIEDVKVADAPLPDAVIEDVKVADAPMPDAVIEDVKVADAPMPDAVIEDVKVADAPVQEPAAEEVKVPDAPVQDVVAENVQVGDATTEATEGGSRATGVTEAEKSGKPGVKMAGTKRKKS